MIDNPKKTLLSWFVAAHASDDCGGLAGARYSHHANAAWYFDLIVAGGKLKGKQSQSKPFLTKDMVDTNRLLKPILVCCLFPDQIFYELSAFPASPDGHAHARPCRSSCSCATGNSSVAVAHLLTTTSFPTFSLR
jgi:hypothetical protein